MSETKRVYVGLGTNMGRRALLLDEAVRHLNERVGNVVGTSFLYESEPELVTDQPAFLNAVAVIESRLLDPHQLLHALQEIEALMGRPSLETRARYGPRPIDLDILCFADGTTTIRTADLIVPHPLLRDRAFVLQPLVDLDPELVVPATPGGTHTQKLSASVLWARLSPAQQSRVRRVMPLGPNRVVHTDTFGDPLLLGIVNATPDSFSGDGLGLSSVQAVVEHIDQHQKDADIVDIGGYSTRPGHAQITVEEEIQRVVPLVQALAGRKPIPPNAATLVSIDTFRPEVARACLDATAHHRGDGDVGAHVVWINDVMGLCCDPHQMVSLLRQHDGVGIVIMHNRGALDAMVRDPLVAAQLFDHGDHTSVDIVERVSRDLVATAAWAESKGIPRWRIVLDPGIGFGKTPAENAALAGGTGRLRALLNGYPLLVAASRKSFMGRVIHDAAVKRGVERESALPAGDPMREHGTHVVTAIAAWEGAHVVRVHDVAASRSIIGLTKALYNGKIPS